MYYKVSCHQLSPNKNAGQSSTSEPKLLLTVAGATKEQYCNILLHAEEEQTDTFDTDDV